MFQKGKFDSIHPRKGHRMSKGTDTRFLNLDTRSMCEASVVFCTQVRGFKPDRSRWIFQGEKILSTASFGRGGRK